MEERKEINDVMKALACRAGGQWVDNTFRVAKSETVNRTELAHSPQTFYCLSVPGSAFVIKSKGKVSVTGNCHAEAGAYVFRVDLQQSNLSPERQAGLFERIYSAARVLREHEHAIADRIFAKGRIEGITAHQLKNFVDSRLDLCLQNLGLSTIFNPASNPIADWFYLGLSQSKMHDFFASQGSAYNRDWAEEEFDWEWEPEYVNEGETN